MNYEKLYNKQKELVKHWIEETVIEAGKWYKNPKNKFLVFVGEINDESERIKGYGFDRDGEWFNETCTGYVILIEATKEEVEQRLIEEAKRRGFVKGNMTRGLTDSKQESINGTFFSNNKTTSLCVHTNGSEYTGFEIYESGKWAEIIDDKAEVKAEIDSITKRLEELKSRL